MVACAHRVAVAVLRGGQAASAESCTHPAKRDHRFPPPIAERQRLPNVRIGDHASHPSVSPMAARLGMCNSLCTAIPIQVIQTSISSANEKELGKLQMWKVEHMRYHFVWIDDLQKNFLEKKHVIAWFYGKMSNWLLEITGVDILKWVFV